MPRGNSPKKLNTILSDSYSSNSIIDYYFLYRKYKGSKRKEEKMFFKSFIHFPTFAKTYLKIRNKEGRIIPFKFNAIQEITLPLLIENNRNIILKYRQGGISTLVAGYYFWLTIMFPNIYTLVIAHTKESAGKLFEIPKRFFTEMLPEVKEFLQLRTKYENKMELFFDIKGSSYYVGSTENEYGRGQTLNNLHLSEFAFWKESSAKDLSAITEAVPLGKGNIIIESTPNGMNEFFNRYFEAKDGKSEFNAIFLPWYKHPEYVYKPWFGEDDLTLEERKLIEKYNLTLPQIAFRRLKQSALKEKFLQEYPEDDISCFLLSTSSVFNLEIIKQIETTIMLENIKPEIQDTVMSIFGVYSDKILKIYKPPQPEKEYVVSVDPAGGDTQSSRTDPTAIVVLEKGSPLKVVAVFNDLIGHTELSALVHELATYYNNALVVVERNNHGHLILYNLSNGFTAHGRKYYPYKNIYMDTVNKSGWLTTQKSKGIIIDFLAEQFQLGGIMIPDTDILNEMRHFVEKRSPTGKLITEAESGYHDDLVMALAFGSYIAKTYSGLNDNDFTFRFTFV